MTGWVDTDGHPHTESHPPIGLACWWWVSAITDWTRKKGVPIQKGWFTPSAPELSAAHSLHCAQRFPQCPRAPDIAPGGEQCPSRYFPVLGGTNASLALLFYFSLLIAS